MIIKFTRVFLLFFGFVVGLVSCGEKLETNEPMPSVLRVGVLPDEAPDKLRVRYAPVLGYLSESLGVECELVLAESYEEMVAMFVDGRMDIANFGGYTFLQVNEKGRARALVMRDVDLRFTSSFLVSADDDREALSDFSRSKLSFGSRSSTSGHLMPRYFMVEQGIVPERYFSEVMYSGAHDKTAELVRDGAVDIGVANTSTVRKMYEDGRLDDEDVRVLWETPPFADYVWVLDSRFDEVTFFKIRDAFLVLSVGQPEHANVLSALGTKTMLPVKIGDFEPLMEVVASLRGELDASE